MFYNIHFSQYKLGSLYKKLDALKFYDWVPSQSVASKILKTLALYGKVYIGPRD